MPTVPRCPAAQQREWLQARRPRAAELFTAGVHQAEVADQLEVSAQAVSVWHARWLATGMDGPRSKGPERPGATVVGCPARYVEQALVEGATANGFSGELWPWSGSPP